MITNRDELTQETIKVLQGQGKEKIDTKVKCKKSITKTVENYVRDDKVSKLIDLFADLLLEFASKEEMLEAMALLHIKITQLKSCKEFIEKV